MTGNNKKLAVESLVKGLFDSGLTTDQVSATLKSMGISARDFKAVKAANVGEVMGFRKIDRNGRIKVQIVIRGNDGAEAKFHPETYPGTLRSLLGKAADATKFLDDNKL